MSVRLPTSPVIGALRWRLAALRLRSSVLRVRVALKAFDPSQPRVPAGSPSAGQWTDGEAVGSDSNDGSVHLAQGGTPERYRVILEDEEVRGRTIAEHVGKTDEEMLDRLRRNRIRAFFYTMGETRVGSFSSVESANDLVNQTLSRNFDKVDDVAEGRQERAFATARFGYKTGREARASADVEPYMRDTYEVGVEIRRDAASPRGYRVETAYPVNMPLVVRDKP